MHLLVSLIVTIVLLGPSEAMMTALRRTSVIRLRMHQVPVTGRHLHLGAPWYRYDVTASPSSLVPSTPMVSWPEEPRMSTQQKEVPIEKSQVLDLQTYLNYSYQLSYYLFCMNHSLSRARSNGTVDSWLAERRQDILKPTMPMSILHRLSAEIEEAARSESSGIIWPSLYDELIPQYSLLEDGAAPGFKTLHTLFLLGCCKNRLVHLTSEEKSLFYDAWLFTYKSLGLPMDTIHNKAVFMEAVYSKMDLYDEEKFGLAYDRITTFSDETLKLRMACHGLYPEWYARSFLIKQLL